MDTITLLGQAVLTGLLAGWLGIGVWENLRAPEVNRGLVSAVLSMRRVRDERPEIYALTKQNRIESPAAHALIWRAVIAAELVATALLVLGTLLLLAAALGLAGGEAARAVAALGAIAFTAVWGGFLVGGQRVHYWAAWKDSQFTHYFMTIWGAVTFVALT